MNDKQEMKCLFEAELDGNVNPIGGLDKDLSARIRENFAQLMEDDHRDRLISGSLNKNKQTYHPGSFDRLDTPQDRREVLMKLAKEPVHISKHFMPPPPPIPLAMKLELENDPYRFVVTKPGKTSFNHPETIEDGYDTIKLRKMMNAIQREMTTFNPRMGVVGTDNNDIRGRLRLVINGDDFRSIGSYDTKDVLSAVRIEMDSISEALTHLGQAAGKTIENFTVNGGFGSFRVTGCSGPDLSSVKRFYFDLEGTPAYSHIHSFPSTRTMVDLLNMKQIGVIGQKSFQPRGKPWIHKRK